MSDQSNQAEEIDLKEILAIFWSNKAFIVLISVFSIFIGGYYIVTADKKFTATAMFEIQQKNQSGFNLPDNVGALASLAGIGNISNNNNEVLMQRVMAREFILDFSKKYLLYDDPFFNSFDPNYVEPLWKSTIKKTLNLNSQQASVNAKINNMVVSNFKKFVDINTFENGIISISVTHSIPKFAAHYSNAIMEEVKQLVEFESDKEQELRLTYLSETLADALQDMEEAQKNLKQYALENSALAQENFISGSLKLDELRMESRKVNDFSNVLSIIEELVRTKSFDSNSYDNLRRSFPLVDDVEFRRILGMSETISDWSWPKFEIIKAVEATLKDRINRLNVEIKNIEENAKIYATSAEDLAKLTRDAKVAEATYTVLIEQVKSQALVAGFKPDTFKVFEYGTTPLKPSSPKRNLILGLSAILGLFMGCVLALINSAKRGRYYTEMSIVSDAQPNLALKSKSLRRLSNLPISKILSHLSNHRLMDVDKAHIKLADKKIIYVLSCGAKATSSGTCRLLASQSARSGKKIILCDQTGSINNDKDIKPVKNIPGVQIANVADNMDALKVNVGEPFFTSVKFKTTVESLVHL